jgi:hypothetical protein
MESSSGGFRALAPVHPLQLLNAATFLQFTDAELNG